MDITKLKRDASIVDSIMVQNERSLIAKKPFDIHIPFRYLPSKLADIGKEIYTAAVFGIVWEGKYAVSNACSSINLTPSSISSLIVDGEEYYVFGFDAGDTITPLIDLVVDDNVAYNIYNEFIGKAKLPWFMNYEDVGKCVANAHHYSGIRLSGTNAVLELLAASIARNPDNVTQFYREVIDSIDEQNTNPPVIFPFKSVITGTTNTMGKLIGSYFDEGITSALTYEGGPSGVEDLFRL